MSFLWQKRLNEGASDLLKHYYADILRRPEMLEALHAYDVAQLIMLAESGRPPEDAIRQLVRAIVGMEQRGVIEERGMSFRVAHSILSTVAKEVLDRDLPPSAITVDLVEAAAVEHTGQPLGLTDEVLRHTLDAWAGVAGRKYRGGTAPERVREHIKAARGHVREDTRTLRTLTRNVERAATKREKALAQLVRQYA